MRAEERFERIEGTLEKLTLQAERQQETIQKQNKGIQTLIVVSRTVLTSVQELRLTQEKTFGEMRELRELHRATVEEMRELHRATVEEMRELSKATDEKLNILIETIDRIIRHRANGDGKPGDEKS